MAGQVSFTDMATYRRFPEGPVLQSEGLRHFRRMGHFKFEIYVLCDFRRMCVKSRKRLLASCSSARIY
jgi:hypothetical protein